MNVLVLLPDGIGVRNFLLAPFVRELSRTDEVTALHVIPDELLPQYTADLAGRVAWRHLLPYRESPLAGAARYSLGYAHMRWADTPAMRFNMSMGLGTKGSWRTRAMHRAARVVGSAMATPAGIRRLADAHTAIVRRLATVDEYIAWLRALRPAVVFCSHQRPPVVIPVIVAAKALGIPTATFIFSWDNLTGKGRIPAPFDHYLVWSAHMRDELRRYYPDVSADHVHVVGTPQFDFGADPTLACSREEFFASIGADPMRPLICYSGGDVGNSPEDQDHLRILMEHLRSGRIRRRAQVLLRPAPVDEGRRFAAVIQDFPELLVAKPQWTRTANGKWDQIFPTRADAGFLANLTRHTDLNVNLGSTMTLDFAIQDRPVINVAFDVASPPPFGLPLWDHHYRFDHYQPVIELGAARFARSADQLADQANQYLDDPSLDREGRRRLVELQLGCPPGDSTSRVVDAVRRIGGARGIEHAERVPIARSETATVRR